MIINEVVKENAKKKLKSIWKLLISIEEQSKELNYNNKYNKYFNDCEKLQNKIVSLFKCNDKDYKGYEDFENSVFQYPLKRLVDIAECGPYSNYFGNDDKIRMDEMLKQIRRCLGKIEGEILWD